MLAMSYVFFHNSDLVQRVPYLEKYFSHVTVMNENVFLPFGTSGQVNLKLLDAQDSFYRTPNTWIL